MEKILFRKFCVDLQKFKSRRQIGIRNYSFCSSEHMIKIHMKKVAFIGRHFGEAFAIVVESLKHESRLGSYDLIWPHRVICPRLTSVVKIVWTSRCSIYEIPCTKLGFNSILVIILRFASSHWLIYYPFGISLVTSLVQKMGCGLGWLSSFIRWDHFR